MQGWWRQNSCIAKIAQAQHSTAQHSKAQQSTAKHSKAQQSTAKHSKAQQSTAKHSKAQSLQCRGHYEYARLHMLMISLVQDQMSGMEDASPADGGWDEGRELSCIRGPSARLARAF
jgi:hypothetical protein